MSRPPQRPLTIMLVAAEASGDDRGAGLARALKGEPVVKINDLAPLLVDKLNVNDPGVQAQLHPDLKKYLD